MSTRSRGLVRRLRRQILHTLPFRFQGMAMDSERWTTSSGDVSPAISGDAKRRLGRVELPAYHHNVRKFGARRNFRQATAAFSNAT